MPPLYTHSTQPVAVHHGSWNNAPLGSAITNDRDPGERLNSTGHQSMGPNHHAHFSRFRTDLLNQHVLSEPSNRHLRRRVGPVSLSLPLLLHPKSVQGSETMGPG